jgi:hypothetical protein
MAIVLAAARSMPNLEVLDLRSSPSAQKHKAILERRFGNRLQLYA